jgi:hypothetical protein
LRVLGIVGCKLGVDVHDGIFAARAVDDRSEIEPIAEHVVGALNRPDQVGTGGRCAVKLSYNPHMINL